jgi:hypothetical protein
MILLVGVTTLLSGIILVLRHLHVWRKQIDSGVEPDMRTFLGRQLRRRTLTSTCIAVLGFTIALMHFTDYWRARPGSYAILVSCSLTLVFMIFVLAMLDMVATTSTLRAQKGETRKAAEELAKEYLRQRNKQKPGSEKPGPGDPPPSRPDTGDDS